MGEIGVVGGSVLGWVGAGVSISGPGGLISGGAGVGCPGWAGCGAGYGDGVSGTPGSFGWSGNGGSWLGPGLF